MLTPADGAAAPSAPAPPPVAPRPLGRGALLAIVLAGCAAYLGVLDVYFLKDDLNLLQLADDAGRPSWESWVARFGWPKGAYDHDQFYRPLPALFALGEFATGGPDPRVFRAVNILFHALNGALLAVLFHRTTGGRRPALAALLGLVFVVHPLHAEAVVWITQRFVVMATTWTLAALIALDAWIRRGGRGAVALCAFFTLLATLSKETAAAAPLLYGAYAFGHPAAGAGRARVGRALRVAAAACLATALTLGLRYALFGTWEGTYGGLPIAEYARVFRTYERLPQSLLAGFVAANPHVVPEAARTVALAGWTVAAGAALAALAPALKHRTMRGAALAFAAFAAGSLAPMLPIFYVEPWLVGARFLYQPWAGLVMLLGLGGLAPRRDGRARSAWPAVLAATLGAALGLWNLRAYHGADAQIRGLQEALLRESRERPDAAFVVHGAPAEHRGVTTVDLYLDQLVRPPLADASVVVFPLVAGRERLFDPERWAAARAAFGDRTPTHLRFEDDPPRLGALFGAALPAEGDDPPEVYAPLDGALVGCPDLRGRKLDAATRATIRATTPTIAFGRVPGAARYRLALTLREAAPIRDGVAPREAVLTLDPARHLVRAGTGYRYALDGGAEEIPEGGLDAWTNLAVNGYEPPPLLVAWRVEAVDAAGRTTGRSDLRRMAVLPVPPR
ncbi:MAG TPA: hypothetical protein VEI02_14860 [Planctomycetota bacterium]|nr:hypothetical protein [Planctomycetota bacterium]